jgi:hypothetical protein
MVVTVHQPQFLPWLGYVDKIDQSDIFVILEDVQYKKQEYQNRNRIKTPKGPVWLTVPVMIKGLSDQNINETLIDNQSDWRRRHLSLLKENYRKAPFFSEYYPEIEAFYMQKRWELLSELNIEMLMYIFNKLGVTTTVRNSTEISVEGVKTLRNVNITLAMGGDTYLSGQGAKEYLEEDLFDNAGVKLRFQEYSHPVYPQLSGEFAPYMGVFDLMFNCGEESLAVIRSGRKAT